MKETFSEAAGWFTGGRAGLLLGGKWGIEREAQRVTESANLALTPHPAAFGDKLENPRITTDFSESQIELVTPPFDTVGQTHCYLTMLQRYAESELGDELLWPMSMPPKLPEEEKIPISRFEGTGGGWEKEIYRNGLALRYGKKMQMISGIHYNFSFGQELLDFLYEKRGMGEDRQTFTDDLYFSAARNFLRFRWLLIYLFGASPNMDETYFPVVKKELRIVSRCCPECCSTAADAGEFATSLRVSRFGYSDSVRGKLSVSYNSLRDYIGGIRRLMETKSRTFSKIGLFRDGRQIQLNENVLQKESEFYSPIRLKQAAQKGESQMDALENRGVGYAEIRIVDLDPYEKTGISLQQMLFLQVFLLFCLLEESKPIQKYELDRINRNHHLVAVSGRKENLELHSYGKGNIPLQEWGEAVLSRLWLVASRMDAAEGGERYRDCIEKEAEKLHNPSLLPSALILSEMKAQGESFLEFGIRKAVEHRGRDLHEIGNIEAMPEEDRTEKPRTEEPRTGEPRTQIPQSQNLKNLEDCYVS